MPCAEGDRIMNSKKGLIITLIIDIVAVILFISVITGCNVQMLDTNFSFTKAYIIDTGEELDITSWRDFDDGDMIQFTSDGVTYLTHSSNVILKSK